MELPANTVRATVASVVSGRGRSSAPSCFGQAVSRIQTYSNCTIEGPLMRNPARRRPTPATILQRGNRPALASRRFPEGR